MKTIEVTVSRIGKGRGVELPAATMRRYKIGKTILLEEQPDAIVLRPTKPSTKLSWEETAKHMAAAKENWSAWDSTVADGLNEL
jgi:antitoxin component of MazEF toxin-antitoxin module